MTVALQTMTKLQSYCNVLVAAAARRNILDEDHWETLAEADTNLTLQCKELEHEATEAGYRRALQLMAEVVTQTKYTLEKHEFYSDISYLCDELDVRLTACEASVMVELYL